MAGLNASIQTGEIATGTAAKTLLQLVAPTNGRLILKEFSVSFDGTSNTAAPIQVSLVRQSNAGTMSSLTPKKMNSSDDETLQSTAQQNATSEPTVTDTIMSEQVHPQAGYTWQSPWGTEVVVPGGGRLAILVTAGADVNAISRMLYEE